MTIYEFENLCGSNYLKAIHCSFLKILHAIVVNKLNSFSHRYPIFSLEVNLFFQLINHLYERSSIILTSNKSPDQWSELMDDQGITKAILDRLLHRVEVVHMDGDSYRMKNREHLFSAKV